MTILPCRNVDPDIFFMPQTVRRAKDLCNKCPAIDACRDVIRGIEQTIGRQDGVWAGMSEEDRRYPSRGGWACVPNE
jgi:Transcription factor WhiB